MTHIIFRGLEALLILFAVSFCIAVLAGMMIMIGAGELNREVDRHWEDDLP